RQQEMLIRAAMGASRLQLIAPLLWESVALCLVSSVVGFGVGYAALVKVSTFKISLGAIPFPSMDLRPDAVVLGATLLVAIAAGVAAGLPAALRAAAEGLSVSLNRELVASEPRKGRVRSALVVIQMAVATIAMIGVGVSIRSFLNLRDVSLGFSARSLRFAE